MIVRAGACSAGMVFVSTNAVVRCTATLLALIDATVALIGPFDAVPVCDHGRVVDVNLMALSVNYLVMQRLYWQGS